MKTFIQNYLRGTTIFLFSCFMFFPVFVQAQNEKDADKLMEKGNALAEKGSSDKALEKFNEAYAIYTELKIDNKEVESLHRIAQVYAANMGDWLNAEIWFLKTLSKSEELKDEDRIARVESSLGVIYEKKGNIIKAEEYHKRALEYFESKGNEERCMLVQKNLGMLYLNKSNYILAEQTFNTALATAQRLNNTNEIGRLTYNLGLNTYKKGNYSKALDLYNSALQILGNTISELDKGELFNNIGIIHAEYGDTLLALRYYSDALKIANQIQHKDLETRVLNNIGNVYLSQEQFLIAIKFFKLSLDISTEISNLLSSSIVLNNIGIVYQKLKQFDEAEDFFNKSKEIKKGIGYIWGNVYQNYCFGNLYIDKQEFDLARASFDEALSMANEMELIDLQYKIHAAYGNLFAHTGDTLSAISSYIKSIEIIEDIRTQIAYEHSRSDFMQTVIPIYKELIYILLNQKNSHLAFDYYERMKARNLLEIIDGVEIVFENKISDEDLYQQSEISAEQKQNTLELNSYCESKEYKSRDLDKILSSQRSLLEKYIDFRSNIYMKYPEIKSKLEVKTPIKCEEAAMMLKARTQAALAYVVGEKQMYCFILKRPTELDYEVNVVSIPVSEKDIKEFTTNLIQEFQIQNQELLYLLLFKPITQYLQGISEICIIPDTYLYSIPFQALINPATKKFVIEDYAISYNYSLSLFKELNEIEHNTTKNILAFGNPDFKNLTIPGINHKFEALPKSEEEVLSIKELYGKDSEIYLGVKASESNFKAKAFNNHILHFATHGIFDNVNPMYSSLILTADTIDDGVLTAGEIFQMDLNAELVVLSACETAKGIMDDGEGILGLSRAFLGAKVPTIVATQWQVDDRSTKLLMEEFYKNLQINPNYTLAMQKAQLHLLNNTRYNNAYFWSPFIVLGASE